MSPVLRTAVVAFFAWGAGACGSVAVPSERFYRLAAPPAEAGDPGAAGVLRVFDLQLGTALDSECLLVADGVRLEPRPLDRWAVPLDRLVTDALVLGMTRAGVFALVKGGADPGAETFTLHGRIVEFAQLRGANGDEARVALELWLQHGDALVFRGEFAANEPVAAGSAPEAVVAALSQGLRRVTQQVVGRMADAGLLAVAVPPR